MATIRLTPSTVYNAAGTSYLTVTSASNAYTDTDSTTCATITNTSASTSNRYIYIRGFNFNDVPSNAIVNSYTVKLKAYQSGGSTNSNYRPYLCNNTTTYSNAYSNAITTSSQVLTFNNGSTDWDTIKNAGSNFGIRVNCRRNSRNTQAVFYIYGAQILVDYTVPVYHNITVTGDSSKVSPTGTESVLQGTSYTVTMDYDSKPTVTDNNVDVTNQLTELSSATSVLIPQSNTNSGWYSVDNIGNAYHDATNDTYASFQLAGGSTGTVYLDLTDISIPSGSTIQNVSCSVTLQYNRNNSSSGFTSSVQMYANTTAKGSSQSWVTAGGTDVAKTTLNLSVGSWTASQINNARFYLTATNNASSTRRYVYIYGVSFSVTYEIDGVIYVYTVNNITADHTIVVTAPTAQNELYVKVNGTWTKATTVYKKVSGSWVQQTNLTSIFDSNTRYLMS